MRKHADELTLAGAESVHGNNVSADPAYVISVAADIRDELEASERDRKALAEARELLGSMGRPLPYPDTPADRASKVKAFLKRTEPTDD